MNMHVWMFCSHLKQMFTGYLMTSSVGIKWKDRHNHVPYFVDQKKITHPTLIVTNFGSGLGQHKLFLCVSELPTYSVKWTCVIYVAVYSKPCTNVYHSSLGPEKICCIFSGTTFLPHSWHVFPCWADLLCPGPGPSRVRYSVIECLCMRSSPPPDPFRQGAF